ncbi:MAG: hypothetical protein RI911_691, partial [Candidatus Parcubacteria bacterium]
MVFLAGVLGGIYFYSYQSATPSVPALEQVSVSDDAAPGTVAVDTQTSGELTEEILGTLRKEFEEKHGESCAALPFEGMDGAYESGMFGTSLHVILPCTSYAYNTLSFVVARDEAMQWHLVPFETYDTKTKTMGPVTYGLMNVSFHALEDELNFFNKY